MKSAQHRLRRIALALFSAVLLVRMQAFADSDGDDFNDNSKNTSKWGSDKTVHNGKLTETNGRLEYTVNAGGIEDDAWRPWILTRFPYTADWEIQLDVFNASAPSVLDQVDSIGILIQPTKSALVTATNEIFLELYSSTEGGLPYRTGFHAELSDAGYTVGTVDSEGDNGVTNGAIRISFTSSNKVFTLYYDTDVSDGYQWVQQATFGVFASGGTNGNAYWELGDTNQFVVSIYGYSAGVTIPSGQMFVDNFLETGGVASNGGTVPDPTGGFDFSFPTNNPLLTRIVSVAGNYRGISPTQFHRQYDFDVAQDETGKLAIMGTIDGYTNKDGSAEVSGGSGAVTTVNGQPTAQLHGTFNGTRDGMPMTFSGKSSVPAEMVDVGGGTNGVNGTGTYTSKVGGVPFSGKNVPIQVAAPAGAVDNLQQNWSLHLDIHKKTVGTKQRTAASAQLVLPNGDTISYADKLINYSARRGYTLSFARGTNITMQPAKIDTHSTIAIKNLTFVQQGQNWQPTGGTVAYKFLGQKGTANLLDLMGP
jgi:hypothetical protein